MVDKEVINRNKMNENRQILSEEQLAYYDAKGLIPAPDETESAFKRRLKVCLDKQNEPAASFADLFSNPFLLQNNSPLVEEQKTSKTLYGFAIDWSPLVFSKEHLSIWHGGCACIVSEEGDKCCRWGFFQLQPALQHKEAKLLFGLYERPEIIAHESCHLARMAFDEPVFEEILAYRTSHSFWRRWLGPLFSSSREALLSAVSLAVFFVSALAFSLELEIGGLEIGFISLFTGGGASVYLTYLFLRLAYRHHLLFKCMQNCLHLIKAGSLDAFVFRLSDKEIIDFACSKPEDVLEYALKRQCPRWRLLKMRYLSAENRLR